mmetsp:Transcript_1654/g.3332  ORF Transcript_1654/g.3332 Transcript_1654/m.3332 type:complete len:430 (+) Transcript_1654:176-1465(+)
MLAALSRFGAPDAARWFRERGVALKTESDGRMFPQTDDSASIVHALTDAAHDAGVDVLLRAKVIELNCLDNAGDDERFEVAYVMRSSTQGSPVTHRCRCRYVLVATGGSPEGLALLSRLKQPLVAPVPSLFTFRLATVNAAASSSTTASSKDTNDDATAAFDWQGLAGVSVTFARLRLEPVTENGGDGQDHRVSAANGVAKGSAKAVAKTKRKGKGNTAVRSEGPLLFTHRGISGPAVLRLSAFGARVLHETGYRCEIMIDWVGLNEEQALAECVRMKGAHAKRGVATGAPAAVALPRRLWARLVASAAISAEATWADVSKVQLRALARALCATRVLAAGKDMNKDEFVTAGGVDLKGVDPRRYESRLHDGLFFAGEVLDVDGVTGGYNFQNAWTSSWIAGSAIADDVARRAAAAEASDVEPVGKFASG